jgi:hypothetical protein
MGKSKALIRSTQASVKTLALILTPRSIQRQ